MTTALGTGIRRVAATLAPTDRPDGELLARFLAHRDEVAFAALVRRHGPMVLGTCRRVLGRAADADDAFQAAFVVLVRKAPALTGRPSVGPFLYTAARHAALKVRTMTARRTAHERKAARPEPQVVPAETDELSGVLDEELGRLPDKYRDAVVLCELEGVSRKEAAVRLGVPEGTLSSRLAAAHRRLAKRLAARGFAATGLAAAFGVPAGAVPAALTVGAVRAAGGPSAGVSYLVGEVMKMLLVNKLRATAGSIAAAVLLVGTGAIAGVWGPVDERPAAKALTPIAARRVAPVPSAPPEPKWKANFRKAYELKDGEVVKRVPKPLLPERADFFLTQFYKTAGTEREEQSRRDFARWGDFATLLVEQDGRKLSYQRSISSSDLQSRPELQRGDNLLTVWTLLEMVTGREEPEITIDPRSKDDPLFEKDNLVVSGDFVVRRNAPLDKLAPQLEKILRDECKVGVRLTMKEEEQPVFVVGGTFGIKPPVWREKDAKQVDVYATEDGLNTEYEYAQHDRGRERAKAVVTHTSSGAPTEFVRSIGSRVGCRMVWDAELPVEPKFSWHNHTVRNPTNEQDAADRDPEKVLKTVTEQTGLTFKKEKRKVQVLYLSAPEKK